MRNVLLYPGLRYVGTGMRRALAKPREVRIPRWLNRFLVWSHLKTLVPWSAHIDAAKSAADIMKMALRLTALLICCVLLTGLTGWKAWEMAPVYFGSHDHNAMGLWDEVKYILGRFLFISLAALALLIGAGIYFVGVPVLRLWLYLAYMTVIRYGFGAVADCCVKLPEKANDEIVRWTEANARHLWFHWHNEFYFVSYKDAVHFKLRWFG